MAIPFAGTYQVKRYESTITDGVVSHTLAETISTVGIVTPLSDRELQVLPEGLRSGARFKFRTETEFDPGLQGTENTFRIVIDSEEYLLNLFGRWNQTVFGQLKHWKYACVSLNE